MTLEMTNVLDEYPNPFFIIRPILTEHSCEDFEYIYANRAFGIFLGRPVESLLGRTFCECFHMKGERVWLDLFAKVSEGQGHTYVESPSPVIGKKLLIEAYHVSGGMCACVIHDYADMSEGMDFQGNRELMHKELLRKAHCDYLTGFYNRFYLTEQYEKIMGRDNVGVTVMDINNLKQVNDTYGHAAGDEMIIRISKMIRAMYRESTVFRMGGDEFVIITLGMDRESFLAMSRCRKAVFEENDLVAMGYRYFDHVKQLKDCIDLCDSLMYEHKRLCKNHYELWHWPVVSRSRIFD